MRIALINPMQRTGQGYNSVTRIPQLGLQVLAQCTPAEHQVEIYDEIFRSDQTEAFLRNGTHDLVGITAMTSGAPRAYELAGICRETKIPVIFGGIHATTCPDEAQPHFDSIVVGEADAIWPGILEDFQAGRLKRRYEAEKLPELSDGFGRAAQTIAPVNGQYRVASLQTSRGCPTGCTFCSVTKVNGARIRRRPIDEIVDEWNSITKPFVFIVDDNFFGVSAPQAEWTKQLLNELIKRGRRRMWFSQTTINMGDDSEALKLAYKAGCRGMLVGLESFQEQDLAQYGKKLNRRSLGRYRELIDGFHRAGIAMIGAVIIGSDNDVPDTIRQAIATTIRLGVDIIQVTNLTPLPGTDLYEEFIREGRIALNNYPQDWEKYTFIHTVFKPKRMTANELDEAMFLFRRGAIERPWVLKRTIKSFFKTRSWTSALFVHNTNKGFVKMGKVQVAEDAKRFPHLLNAPATAFPD